LGQDICIDDPFKPDSATRFNTRFSLSPAKRTYKTPAAKGRITSESSSAGGGRRFEVYPPIFESSVIELSRDKTTAKGVGSLYKYFYKCK